ncbi:MAG TPA: response regulator [Polyangiaceae bacterium]
MKVLVVDDSDAIRSRLVSLLRELPGADVHEATRADEALALCRAMRVDAVLLDLHMPGKWGLAIVASLKALDPPPVVVVMTGHPTEHHRRSSLAAGADYFFDKSHEFEHAIEILVRPTPTRP